MYKLIFFGLLFTKFIYLSTSFVLEIVVETEVRLGLFAIRIRLGGLGSNLIILHVIDYNILSILQCNVFLLKLKKLE